MDTTCLLLFYSALLTLLADISSASSVAPTARLIDIGTRYWAWRLKESPKYATYRGLHIYNDRLEEYNLQAWDRRKKACEEFLSELQTINEDDLTSGQFQDYEVLKADLEYYLAGYKWRMYGALNPINFLEGIHRSHGWIKAMAFTTFHDFETYKKRMRAYVRQIEEIIVLMKEAIRLNRTNHAVSMVAVPEQIGGQTVLPVNETQHFWPYDVAIESSHLNSTIRMQIKDEGYKIIKEELLPTQRKLLRFIVEEYMPNTRKSYGVGSFDNGTEYYQACLRFHLSTNLTAQEVRDIGLKEVGRIEKLMLEIMEREGFSGTINEFFNFLREKRGPQFYQRTSEELLEEYRNIIFDRINPKLGLVLKNIPKNTLRVEPMTFDGPSGSYGSGTFYANVRKAEDRPSFTMMALALHEANPGHHLQTVFTKDQELPDFRRHATASKYYAVPFNFPWHTAYTEGWGLYAEYLGEEMGCYNTTALELLGRYSSEMFRACRLVIDTGIHVFGMSRDDAISYLSAHTAIPLSQIEKEVDRYITWPGQACAYKIGELEILRLRRKAEEELGELFDVREFNHLVLLTGRVPLSVLEKDVLRWIQKYKTGEIIPRQVSSAGCSQYSYVAVVSALGLTVINLQLKWLIRNFCSLICFSY